MSEFSKEEAYKILTNEIDPEVLPAIGYIKLVVLFIF